MAVKQDGSPQLLAVEGLSAEYHSRHGIVHAVNGVSFNVERGELVGIVGETGCGKSTVARAVLRLVRPPGTVTAGSVRFDGEEVLSMPRSRLRKLHGSGIAFVPQSPWGALNPVLTIGAQTRNVIRAHRRLSGRECDELAVAALRSVGIAGPERVLRSYPHELSGGMAQRAVIAIATILDPRLLIADEPTTALDVTIQRQILDLMAELSERDHRAMLIVTHHLGVVAQYCHRVIVMYAGKVVEAGPAADVLRNPAHPYTKMLLAAIPRPGAELAKLPGSIPDLVDYPKGCPFAARCAYVLPTCATDPPAVRPIGVERELSCHLPEGVVADVTAAT